MTFKQEQSAAALKHVHYEIEALLLMPPHNASNETIVETIYFRKMAHSRALHSFFTTATEHRHKDDILAEDYGFRHRPIYADGSKQRILDRINQDLLHISYTRLTRLGADKQWLLSEVLPPVIERCKEFIPHVLALPWPSILEDERKRWRSLIPNYLSGTLLQQNTSNVAPQQTTVIELPKHDP